MTILLSISTFGLPCSGQNFGPSYASSSSPGAAAYGPPDFSSFGTKINWQAAERLVARSDWPKEFILILDELQEHLVTPDEREAFLRDLYYLDQAYDILAKAQKIHLHFLVKALIYKGLLNWRPKVILGPNLYAPSTIEALEQQLNATTVSPLVAWFIQGIIRDLKTNLNEKSTLQRNAATMALSWGQSFMAGLASFELDFYPALEATWHHLAKQIYLQAYLSLPFQNKSLNFTPNFTLPLRNFAKALLPAEVIGSAGPTIATTPKINHNLAALWFATPDPNYTAPANLPTPVNDWNWRPAE